MTVKVHVMYVGNDSVHHYPEISGEHVNVQMWDGGRSMVTVLDGKHGNLVRAVMFKEAISIDREFSDDHYTS